MKLAEILTGPETWCQGRMYQREWGRIVRSCLIGGIRRLAIAEGRTPQGSLLPRKDWDRLMRILPVPATGAWNDERGRTWEEIASVVEAYDRDRLLNP